MEFETVILVYKAHLSSGKALGALRNPWALQLFKFFESLGCDSRPWIEEVRKAAVAWRFETTFRDAKDLAEVAVGMDVAEVHKVLKKAGEFTGYGDGRKMSKNAPPWLHQLHTALATAKKHAASTASSLPLTDTHSDADGAQAGGKGGKGGAKPKREGRGDAVGAQGNELKRRSTLSGPPAKRPKARAGGDADVEVSQESVSVMAASQHEDLTQDEPLDRNEIAEAAQDGKELPATLLDNSGLAESAQDGNHANELAEGAAATGDSGIAEGALCRFKVGDWVRINPRKPKAMRGEVGQIKSITLKDLKVRVAVYPPGRHLAPTTGTDKANKEKPRMIAVNMSDCEPAAAQSPGGPCASASLVALLKRPAAAIKVSEQPLAPKTPNEAAGPEGVIGTTLSAESSFFQSDAAASAGRLDVQFEELFSTKTEFPAGDHHPFTDEAAGDID